MGSSSQSYVQDRLLVVMAKAPKPGSVKTRLTASLSSSAVIALYCSLLQDTVELAKSIAGQNVALMCPQSDREELAQFVGPEFEVVAQNGNGLAAGLTTVFQRFAVAGRSVIAFNSDSPHLPPSVLYRAFEVLASHDVVIGPTKDGGYYLVGAKAAHPDLFGNDGLGTCSALERLLERTRALELSTGFTETFYDIDIAADLLLLKQELRLTPAKAPRTAAWFTEWEEEIASLRVRLGEL